ncbi:MAG: hypothetical protein ACREJ5_19105 [Geminicoccaceae bacterium]
MADDLFDGEEIRRAGGYPLLVRFFPGSPGKPLVVFFPGWAHLGRIAYGVPGCDPASFPAHWITRKGYPFLATSYPLDHPVYERPYPGFTLSDWGDTVAEVAREVIAENRLSGELIGISWSAAGQAMRPFNVACRRLGLQVRWHLGIEASPAMLLPPARTQGIERTARNMISLQGSHYAAFWSEIEAMSRMARSEILPRDLYLRAFVGDVPVGLLGTSEWFEDNQISRNVEKSMEDKDFFAFPDYPLCAMVSGSSASFAYHPIVDRSTWTFLLTRKIWHGLLERHPEIMSRLSEEKFALLLDLLDRIPERLHMRLPGNHFCFLGARNARAIADSLDQYGARIGDFQASLADLTGLDVAAL